MLLAQVIAVIELVSAGERARDGAQLLAGARALDAAQLLAGDVLPAQGIEVIALVTAAGEQPCPRSW